MKLWAIAMVRNEEDVIEAFARHTLAQVDGLSVLAHNSTDATVDILSRLHAEQLPVFVFRLSEPGLYKAMRLSQLARHAFTNANADFVLPLDADEFLSTPGRGTLETALSEASRAAYPAIAWRTYVPTAFSDSFGPHCLRTRLAQERRQRIKVAVPRAFLDRQEHVISEGSHSVLDMRSGQAAPACLIPQSAAFLAHCPVRSAPQLEAKVRLGYEARLAAGAAGTKTSFHWREIHEDLQRGMRLDEGRLRLIACNYGLPREEWAATEEIGLVEDPIELLGGRGGAAER